MAQVINNRIEVKSDYGDFTIKGFVEKEGTSIQRIHGSFLINDTQIGNFDVTTGKVLSIFLDNNNIDKLAQVATNLPIFFTEIESL